MSSEHRPPVVVHVTTIPMTLGFLRGHVAYLKARGFDVHAVSSPEPGLSEFGEREEVPVHGVFMHRGISPLRDLVSVFKLWCVLRKIRPQIVHAHTPKAGLLAMIAALLARVPIRIYHILGLRMMTTKGWKRRLLAATERIACRLAHQVFCVSGSVCAEAVSMGLCPDSKIGVPAGGSICGVDAYERFNPNEAADGAKRLRCELGIPSDADVVGYIGRLARDKGLCELAQAWEAVNKSFASAHLLVVGPPEPNDPLPPQVLDAMGEDPRVHLAGWVEELTSVYGAMQMLVLASYREGLPQVLIEAAAMEVPVVATRIPGIVDAVEDGTTGTLVPVGDSAALADAIRAYLEDEELRLRHGRAGRQRVLARFCPQDIFEAVYKEYLRLMRERNLPLPHGASDVEKVDR